VTFRHMITYSINTYKWVNAKGEIFYVRYSIFPDKFPRGLSNEDYFKLRG
jgi:catalase